MADETRVLTDVSEGAQMIVVERVRQVLVLEMEAERDSAFQGKGSKNLELGAVSYILEDEYYWPWPIGWRKPSTRLRNLVRAGALIAAQIDQILYEEGFAVENNVSLGGTLENKVIRGGKR